MTKLAYVRQRVYAGIRDEGGIAPAIRKSIRLLCEGGLSKLLLGDSYHLTPLQYSEWVKDKDTLSDEQVAAASAQCGSFAVQPKFSIIVPVYETPVPYLSTAVESVRSQIYPHWEICLADDASKSAELHAYLDELESDDRVRVVRRSENGHISQCSNSALAVASGDWVVLLDHDDALSIDALFEIARAINDNPGLRMVYSDEDKLDKKGRRARPYFKPEFNLELLRQNNYVCHLVAYRRHEVEELGRFRAGFEGAQDHDLALRYTERLIGKEICRIPKILYHWREHSGSTALGIGVKSYALQAGQRAVAEHLERSGVPGVVEADSRGFYTVHYALPDARPSVAIIIPTRNQLGLLKQCVESILRRSTYPNYQICIVDNGSDCAETKSWLEQQQQDGTLKVLRDNGPFNFSRLNNFAVSQVDAEFVLMLNNDTEVVSGGWLEDMVATATQKDVGAVGAKLLYPDDKIQHAGVVVGIGGSAGHAFKGVPRNSPGYWFRASLRSEFSAVTGACLLVRRSYYLEVGGLDEQAFAIAFNDVDFCLKLAKKGLRNMVCTYSELTHYESKSRGYENTPAKAARFSEERTRFRQRWLPWVLNDPCYNPNLTRDTEYFGHDWRFSERTREAIISVTTPDDLDALSQLSSPVGAGLIALLKNVLWFPRALPPVVLFVGRELFELADWLLPHEDLLRVIKLDCHESPPEVLGQVTGPAGAPVALVIVAETAADYYQSELENTDCCREAIVHLEVATWASARPKDLTSR